ncbi:hypothetical protein BH10BDE1_BH10BDE1_32840 [soil metagenome]
MISGKLGLNVFVVEYRRTARRHWIFYAVASLGAVLAIAPFFLNGPTSCAGFECQNWLRGSAIALGLLCFFGGALTIARNWQFGSRVDFGTHELIWWEGYPPSDEQRISIDRIQMVRVESGVDDGSLKLIDAEGETLKFSGRCVPQPWPLWAEKMNANFPHIAVELK